MDERGRVQAFRRHGVAVDKPRRMALGPIESVIAVAASEQKPELLFVLKRLVTGWRRRGTRVLETDAVAVRALVGIGPERPATVVKPRLDEAGLDVVGKISTPR